MEINLIRTMTFINIILPFILAPLMLGIINRTKAFFAGRNGPPLLQLYYDLFKLLRKGTVYSITSTWVFQAVPLITLAAISCAVVLLPGGTINSPLGFTGDLILMIYLLGTARFFTVLGALDTGSSLEGMGASREVQFAVFAEPAFILSLAALAFNAKSFSLSDMFGSINFNLWIHSSPVLILVIVTLMLVLLTENSRVPVDDPGTHLELTMIHEVMVLDYSGPNLGLILYGAAIKLWLFSAMIVAIALPVNSGNLLLDRLVFIGGMFALSVVIGVVESVMARFRLLKIPQILIGTSALSLLALILLLR